MCRRGWEEEERSRENREDMKVKKERGGGRGRVRKHHRRENECTKEKDTTISKNNILFKGRIFLCFLTILLFAWDKKYINWYERALRNKHIRANKNYPSHHPLSWLRALHVVHKIKHKKACISTLFSHTFIWMLSLYLLMLINVCANKIYSQQVCWTWNNLYMMLKWRKTMYFSTFRKWKWYLRYITFILLLKHKIAAFSGP